MVVCRWVWFAENNRRTYKMLQLEPVMSSCIEIPERNQKNIPIFPVEPDAATIDEIKQHVRSTSSPQTWRGHSHTKPPDGAFPVYIDEFDVPAPDTVHRVAPCPCCNPHHPQYKNKGKIAWFPNENVIRLIGPQCFAAINAAGHEEALIDLRKRKKRRDELATIDLHAPGLHALIDALSEASAIADDLDDFQRELNRVIDSELQLNLWREVKGGNLSVIETQRIRYRKPDGSIGEKREDSRVPFSTIRGHAMIDRSGQLSTPKLGPLCAGLIKIADRLDEIGSPETLADAEREAMAKALTKARADAIEILARMRERQLFLTTGAIEELDRWAAQPNAPIHFSIGRKRSEVQLTANPRHLGLPTTFMVQVGSAATSAVPDIEPLTDRD